MRTTAPVQMGLINEHGLFHSTKELGDSVTSLDDLSHPVFSQQPSSDWTSLGQRTQPQVERGSEESESWVWSLK